MDSFEPVPVEAALHGEAGAQQPDPAQPGRTDCGPGGVRDVGERDADRCCDLGIHLVHGVGGEHQDLRPRVLQPGRVGGQKLPSLLPVAGGLQPLDLGEVVGTDQQAGGVHPAQPGTHFLVDDLFIDDRRFPAHSAQQPDRLHSSPSVWPGLATGWYVLASIVSGRAGAVLYAQIGLTRSWARELAPFGITVNTVAPGFIPVERHADVPDDVKKAYLAPVPAGRMGTPGDIAHAVSFLASEGAGFITGQRIVVDSGRSLANRTPVHMPW